MPRIEDIAVWGTDEMIDREWQKARLKLDRVSTGNERMDDAADSLAEHSFRAGWLAALASLIEAENRRDGA